MRDFFSKGIEEGGGSHLVNWERVIKPVGVKELDIGNIRASNSALMSKNPSCLDRLRLSQKDI